MPEICPDPSENIPHPVFSLPSDPRDLLKFFDQIRTHCSDDDLSVEIARLRNRYYRKKFGYDPKKLKNRILNCLTIWKEEGLTVKEIAEEISLAEGGKPRADFEKAIFDLIKSKEIFVLYEADQPHQMGRHIVEVYSVK